MCRLAWMMGPFLAAPFFLLGCEKTGETVDPAMPPRGAVFRPVAEVLVDRCGTLDCHGSKYRNMRLFGLGSARLAPSDLPDRPEMTDAEVERDYEAVVSVEPEIIRQVVADGGRAPERLTLIRKARGAEAHKGGTAIAADDPADTCLTSWLASNVDVSRCASAVNPLRR